MPSEIDYKEFDNALIEEFMKTFNQIEEEMDFQLKDGDWNDKIKNQTGEGRYWSGYRYGLQAFWSDFVLPEKEKWKNKLIEE